MKKIKKKKKKQYKLLRGDCLKRLKKLPSGKYDSLVTDPPAGIKFMSKKWDDDKGGRDVWIEWMTSIMKECLRIMKPGAHGFVWALPRTSHWTATALEDAGFEVRDIVIHAFGSGFPKSHNISKGIDKKFGALKTQGQGFVAAGHDGRKAEMKQDLKFRSDYGYVHKHSTDQAKQWDGYGTALKPASEHWILIRKPLSEKSIVDNVLRHGTGGINVDASRVGANVNDPNHRLLKNKTKMHTENKIYGKYKEQYESEHISQINNKGRFPANLVLSHTEQCKRLGRKKVKPGNGSGRTGKGANGYRTQYVGGKKKADGFIGSFVDKDGTETVEAWDCHESCPIRLLDEQSGYISSSARPKSAGKSYSAERGRAYQGEGPKPHSSNHSDSGGASRFFYCAKASKSERNAGCGELYWKKINKDQYKLITKKRYDRLPEEKRAVGNIHPTVKSQKLMRYLCRMLTPPNGKVLDPFMGSGSTGVAAIHEGFRFLGIDAEKVSFIISQKRIRQAKRDARKSKQ